MKLGLVTTAYNSEPWLEEFLNIWGEVKRNSQHDITLAFIHNCFKENYELGLPIKSRDKTHEILSSCNFLDFYRFSDEPLIECNARNVCLNFVKSADVNYVFGAGTDELYTPEELENTFNFIEDTKEFFPHFYRIHYKNYVFDGKGWISGFCPPRVWDTRNLGEFYGDDDVYYVVGGRARSYLEFSSIEIPKSVAHVKHMTWLHSNGKEKAEYQKKRWGKDGCSYSWNYEKGELEFNRAYYEKIGGEVPIIHYG